MSSHRWKLPHAAAASNEDSNGTSSISDIFADMLLVNEDLITAVAESQGEGDIDGLIAYQCVLHRDLMEMAKFVDSMFGVYSTNIISSDIFYLPSTKSSNELPPMVVDLTTEGASEVDPMLSNAKSELTMKKTAREKVQHGALLTAIEAEEKIRQTQRSKEQWIESRHRVLEEESASVILSQNLNDKLEVTTAKAGETQTQQGLAGIALANQLRAHQYVAEILENNAADSVPPMPHSNLMFASLLATLPSAFPAPSAHFYNQQYIKPATDRNSIPKIALPPARFMPNMLLAFPGAAPLMYYPQVVGGALTTPHRHPQLQTTLPVRHIASVRPPAKNPNLKRMCESCRKRHLSVRQCRLVFEHTDPEWQTGKLSSAVRQRKRKQSSPSSS
ncbi:uncharacterized protein PHALS_00135 [Plasmopara halstedii]|uniref:Uncharacterized protein n=1 Tax=Plasmopara halstedii TaxID=4781 RepID=A0A0P1A6N3_PLAHL|nr:uncharacterized protein PHALS_00135 [Plasmopara halstedii]CEG35805.1 hypothetical protein PHALS_00135 [Plasmopara halstedii]|eukprot:XP_024572174.1 hypothetical protein PHALS_00135 [Plasmopara halstedii]